ncbi:MAG: hypothetical protein ACXAEU_19805 [Candidatus Hodarchaeales archaeon]|jgi:hypothetical protein
MYEVNVVLGRNDTLRSKAIRWLTDSDWSHAWLEVRNMSGYASARHCTLGGVDVVSALDLEEEYPTHVKFVVVREHAENNLAKTLVRRFFCETSVAKYDYLSVIWNGTLLLLLRFLGLQEASLLKYAISNDKKFTCSEFVAYFLHAIGYGIKEEHPSLELVTPQKLHDYCTNRVRF